MNKLLKHKRILATLLLFLTIIGLFPVEVLASKDLLKNNKSVANKANVLTKEDMFIYEDEEKTILIDFKGGVDVVEIPDQVTIIKKEALKNKGIKQLKLNERLTNIEDEAFANNEIFGSIILPSTLEEVGVRAFADNLIQKVDFTKASDLKLNKSAFQDNKISGKLDISNLIQVPENAFWGNEISDIDFSDELVFLGREAFANNKLTSLQISSKKAVLEEDVFAGNGQYVSVYSETLSGQKSKNHQYGHVVNPINIIVHSLEKVGNSYKEIKSTKIVEFNPFNSENFLSLNQESTYEADILSNYILDKEYHKDRLITFIPDKDMYELNIYYKKKPNPIITLNINNLKDLIKNKKEGEDITTDELLNLVSAKDYLGNDISGNIKVSPDKIINAEAKEYKITYSVLDSQNRSSDYKVSLPIAIDPFKIKISNTGWQLGDFIYDGNKVINLSEQGKEKSKILSGIAIPHMNPETIETIEIIDFDSPDNDENEILLDKPSVLAPFIRSGKIIFGDPESIVEIKSRSFSDVKITDPLPLMPKLESIGIQAFYSSKKNGTFPNMKTLSNFPKLEYIGAHAFDGSVMTGNFPNLANLKYIGKYAFNLSEFVGNFPKLSNLEYLGDYAFYNSYYADKMTNLPTMPKLQFIGNSGFAGVSNITKDTKFPELKHIGDRGFLLSTGGNPLPDFPKLEYIGEKAFMASNSTGPFPKMPKLQYISNMAFERSKITGQLPEMPSLEYIGEEAFISSRLSGQLPDMPNLKHIGDNAFRETKISGSIPKMPKLEYIGELIFYGNFFPNISGPLPEMSNIKHIGKDTFNNEKITGPLPDMPNVEIIKSQAFSNAKISGPISEMPKVKAIGWNAFSNTNLSGQLPDFPSLIELDAYAFASTRISGKVPEMPKVESYGSKIFDQTTVGGTIPYMPNLKSLGEVKGESQITLPLPKMPKLEVLEQYAFRGLNLTNASVPDLSNVIKVKQGAFDGNSLITQIPNLPNLREIGHAVFYDTNIDKKIPFYINNDLVADKNSFRIGYPDYEKQILLTHDGKAAPNVPSSDYHVLNPANIGFVGKDSKGNTLLNTRLIAVKSGTNLTLTLPKIQGYFSPSKITISTNDLVNNSYTYVYKSYEDIVDENGGGKYQFKFTPISPEGIYDSNQIINSKISLSTANENILKKGEIVIEYDKYLFGDFFVKRIKGINDVKYRNGKVEIILEPNLSQGTEMVIPISFTTIGGSLSKSEKISATLFDGGLDNPKAYGSVNYGINYVDPIYSSTFDNESQKVENYNIVVDDLSKNYFARVTLYPKLERFIRDFENIEITYDIDKHYDKNAKAITHETRSLYTKVYSPEGRLVYKYDTGFYKGNPELPVLIIDLENPAATKSPLVVKSTVEATYRDASGNLKKLTFNDINEFNIFPEERPGDTLSKEISGPHNNGRHSYFYDNLSERSLDFAWNLFYKIKHDIKELVLTDHELDSRMFYKGVDPNGKKALVIAYDKDENILVSKNISEKYIFDNNINKKISKIDIKYYNLQNSDFSVKPIVLTQLKDPNKSHYVDGNINNINRFYNNMITNAIMPNGENLIGKDFAFTDVVKDNKELATIAKTISSSSNLSYGKTATSRFSLVSNNYFNKNIKNFKYTVLIEPGNRLEDVIIKNDVLATYKTSTTKNGYTKIDFDFINNKILLPNAKKDFVLFDIRTTPTNKNVSSLKIHGLLHKDTGDDYSVYNTGNEIVEGINTNNYSYGKDAVKIVNGEFFSVAKLAVKENYVGADIKTKPGEKFYYRFEIDNSTNSNRSNFVLIDVLPFKDDFNNSSYRNKLDLSESIKLPSGFSIKYYNPTSDINVPKRSIIKNLNNVGWSNSPNENTKAIKITANRILMDNLYQIDIPMITNSSVETIDAGSPNINQFAYTHSTLGYEQALSNPVYQETDIEMPTKDISLTKVSHSMGKEDGVIEDVEFAIKDTNGKLISIRKTGPDGKLTFKNIPAGNYIVEEVSILDGYKEKADLIYITIDKMLSADKTLDIGKVINNRVDEFDYLLKNVELIDDLSKLNYSNLKNIYSRDIKGAEFIVKSINTGLEQKVVINNRFGEMLKLSPGKYSVQQIVSPKDNGLVYKSNTIKYMVEIDELGKPWISSGKGDILNNLVKQDSEILYFPNTIDYKTSTINVLKTDKTGKTLANAEFSLININTGEVQKGVTDSNGLYKFINVNPGIYSLKETKAPKGYIESNQVEIIDIPISISQNLNFKFINNKINLNIHKYKIIANHLSSKSIAEDIAKNTISYTGGAILVKKVEEYYQVREVWENSEIGLNDKIFKTNKDGSVLNAENSLEITKDTLLNISNNTMVPGHYEPLKMKEFLGDYISQENFDGTIDIDVIVSPLSGSIYVSKYVIDKNGNIDNKEDINGTIYELHVNKMKSTNRSDVYELVESKTVENNNYVLFKDLNPLYNYKVVETFTPESHFPSNPNEYNVVLRRDKSYVETVVFRNYTELEEGSVYINKVDGRTDQPLQGVEFEIIDRHGVGVKYTTDSQGNIAFEDLRHDLAPYTIKEIKAAPGYRISSQTIVVTEEDILKEEIFTVKNYKYNETPKTGTSGKLPYFLLSIPLIVLAYVFNKKKY